VININIKIKYLA